MDTTLLDSFNAGFDALPADLANAHHLMPLRLSALRGAVVGGLPDHQTEEWKYTSLRALSARPFALTGTPVELAPEALAAIPAPRLVLVNGVVDTDLSQLDDLAEGLSVRTFTQVLRGTNTREAALLAARFEGVAHVFARLNAAVALDGAFVQVAADARIVAPLHLVFVGAPDEAGDLALNLRHLIELRENASLTVIEHHLGAGDHRHLHNHVFHVHLKPGSSLVHARLQDDGAEASVIARTDAVLARDASYRRLDLELGAGLSRHDLNVSLQGEHASVSVAGALLADRRRHLDTRLRIEHVAGNTCSRVNWRAMADARGRAAFHGGIIIRAGADGSDAALSSRNLLLSEDAEIDAQPVLEIHADEVKAAHGASVGQLDADALFYLRSRGIDEAQARTLLTTAFCREVLDVLDNAELAVALGERLDAALQRQPLVPIP